jgi:sugar phosphate isomerase/epimerase
MPTRTGGFTLGFRRRGGWQADTNAVAKWARSAGFEAIDVSGQMTPAEVAILKENGLSIGSADLLDWPSLFSADLEDQKKSIALNTGYMESMVKLGAKRFFLVVMPKNPSLPLAENFNIAVKGLAPLAAVAEKLGAMIVIEGWPGGWWGYTNQCCNPETYRRMLTEVSSKGLGINYDPSHLIRMGIDPIRFLKEFIGRVGHVHAKDTEIMTEKVYEFGLYQPSVFEAGQGFGEYVWRYTIPGHGQMRWRAAFEILQAAGWKGVVSVELEDKNYNGTEAGEKQGLIDSLVYLQTV